jgi:hypothetical protein
VRDFLNGGKGTRTPDLLDAIETLSQLSYAPGCILKLSERCAWVKVNGLNTAASGKNIEPGSYWS